MNDLSELESVLPLHLQVLAAHVGDGQLSRSGLEHRLDQRARRRTVRRVVGGVALMLTVLAGAGAMTVDGQDRGRPVMTGDGAIAPAGQSDAQTVTTVPHPEPRPNNVEPGPEVPTPAPARRD